MRVTATGNLRRTKPESRRWSATAESTCCRAGDYFSRQTWCLPSYELNSIRLLSIRAHMPILSHLKCTFVAKCVALLISSKQMDKYSGFGPSRSYTVRFCQTGVRERTVGLQLLRREIVKEVNICFWREWQRILPDFL